MLQKQLEQVTELLTNAVDYNLAMQAAFVSQEKFVDCALTIDGKQQVVSIPTYNYLLSTIQALSETVQNMQVDADGNDVLQLLDTGKQVQLLYLQKRQYYVQSLEAAKIVKYDNETVPSLYSSADRTAMYVDLTDCHIPADSTAVLAKFDDENPMLLPILSNSKVYNKIATILTANGMLITTDTINCAVNDIVQIRSVMYTVVSIVGNMLTLKSDNLAAGNIQPGDTMYTLTDALQPYVEIPISKLHTKLTLQLQAMQLLSNAVEFDVSNMSNALHESKMLPLSTVLTGKPLYETLLVAANAYVAPPATIDEIVQESKPVISNVTVSQTNAHQFVNSVLGTMLKLNASIEQARIDITRLEDQISVEIDALKQLGQTESETLTDLKSQLASAKTRYNEARQELSKLSMAAQTANPTYAATVYCKGLDSQDKPILQFILRYQRLPQNVSDLTKDWQYVYGDRRTVGLDGAYNHPIDQYGSIDSISFPIYAYEQVAIQVASVLQYGQPFAEVMTDWSDVQYVTIPDTLLQEVTFDQMLKNAYEAKLYVNVQEALSAAGVTKHINTSAQYMHNAVDVLYKDNVSVYDIISNLQLDITNLKNTDEAAIQRASTMLAISIRYNGVTYDAKQGSVIDLQAVQSYYNKLFTGSDNESDVLGSIAEEQFEIIVTNVGTLPAKLLSIFPGQRKNIENSAYDNIPVYADDDSINVQTLGMSMYRSKATHDNSVILIAEDWYKKSGGLPIPQNNEWLTFQGVDAVQAVNQDNILYFNSTEDTYRLYTATGDYDGIGIHVGFKDGTDADTTFLADAADMSEKAKTLNYVMPYNVLNANAVQAEYTDKVMTDNFAMSRFTPEIKHTSGKQTRGAAMFMSPGKFSDMLLGMDGANNSMTLQPNETYIVPCTFQARMTDRLGLTDTSGTVAKDASGKVVLSRLGGNFEYKKTMNVNIQVAGENISFDVSMSMKMYD